MRIEARAALRLGTEAIAFVLDPRLAEVRLPRIAHVLRMLGVLLLPARRRVHKAAFRRPQKLRLVRLDPLDRVRVEA